MTTQALVERWRFRLRATLLLRAVLGGGAAGVLAVAVLRLAAVPAGAGLSFGALVAVAVSASMLARPARRDLTPGRTALWIEERSPALRYALVSALESPVPDGALDAVIRSVPWEPAARSAMLRSLRIPAAALALGVLAWFVVPPALARQASRSAAASGGVPAARRVAGVGSYVVTVAPPAYARRPPTRLQTPVLVRALAGSVIELSGPGAGAASESPRVLLDGRPLDVTADGARWRARATLGATRALLRASRNQDARLIALEPVLDSAPVVTLKLPARDTVLREPRGALALAADVRDDLGIASAAFEYIVSSGEGERFTFKSGTLAATRPGGASAVALRTSLSLDALALVPGDVVHLRAVARDANDVTGPGVGTSDARTIRIARAGEYDSLAVEAAAPPEVDKSILSQRMLINMTEALVKRQKALPRQTLLEESTRIARDQARLRKQVSDIVFARLGSAGSGEESVGDDEARGALTPEQLLAAAERATEIKSAPLDFSEDETPVVAVNRPLLEAYNAMWDAGRSLGAGEPKRALPPMYVALAAIQKARAAERLYLRGAPPRVVVDLARVRLQAKERGTPGSRSPRAALEAGARDALARLARATLLLPANALGAIDSLVVLRLAVVDRHPLAATALEAAVDALRGGGDATAALVRARRSLDDALIARDSLGAWGMPR